jgi:predicted lipid carrier protein YhbT
MAATPKSASELFDTILPAAIAKNPAAAQAVGAIYVFKVSGDGGGEWTVDLKSNPPTVSKSVQAGAECTIDVAGSDFVAMLANPAMGMQLFMQGKLRVSGNPMLAMKLQNLFKLSDV